MVWNTEYISVGVVCDLVVSHPSCLLMPQTEKLRCTVKIETILVVLGALTCALNNHGREVSLSVWVFNINYILQGQDTCWKWWVCNALTFCFTHSNAQNSIKSLLKSARNRDIFPQMSVSMCSGCSVEACSEARLEIHGYPSINLHQICSWPAPRRQKNSILRFCI